MKKTLPRIWGEIQADLLVRRVSREFYFKMFGAKELKENERRCRNAKNQKFRQLALPFSGYNCNRSFGLGGKRRLVFCA